VQVQVLAPSDHNDTVASVIMAITCMQGLVQVANQVCQKLQRILALIPFAHPQP
jgi:hypothetical protein